MSHGVPAFMSHRGRKGLAPPVRAEHAEVAAAEAVVDEIVVVEEEVVEEIVVEEEVVEEIVVEEEIIVDGDVAVEPSMDMTRAALNEMALALGIEDPDKLGNKQDVVDAIIRVLHPVAP